MKLLIALLVTLVVLAANISAQTTAFTYQGKLSDSGNPANGVYDLQFKLFTALGVQEGATVLLNDVQVSNGVFSVPIDFGVCATCFDGGIRLLEIAVRAGASSGAFTTLTPRQPVTSDPYAIKSLNAATADGLSVACVSCVTSSQISSVSGSQVSGPIPVASVPAGSASYVQNTTTPSQSADFNISGTGTANILSAATQYNIGGVKVLSVSQVNNLFAGFSAGAMNTGNSNSFFGNQSGTNNTSGGANSFFGSGAGSTNSGGSFNTLIGASANVGSGNLTNATAIGSGAIVSTSNTIALGRSNGSDIVQIPGALTVSGATIIGGTLVANILSATTQYNIGGVKVLSVSQVNNLFAGYGAGAMNTGNGNSFFGQQSGANNTSGGVNSFFGVGAGSTNLAGSFNTLFGASADVGSGNLTNATALGSNALVSQSNSLVLGSINGANNATADTNVGIGTSAPLSRLQVVTANDTSPSNILAWDARHFVSGGTAGSGGVGMSYDQTNNVGYFEAVHPGVGWGNLILQSGGGNVGIGTGAIAPTERLQVANGSIRWANSLLQSDQGGTIELGGTSTIPGSGAPYIDFHFNGKTEDFNSRIMNDADGQLSVISKLRVASLGSGGISLCRDGNNVISNCSSSLRYKTDVRPFNDGLNFINRLRPIAFSWKDGGMKDVGFGAEDVEKISPLLVTYNSTGQVEGVKYDRLSVVFVNAFKEQQTQIESLEKQSQAQQEQVERQQKQIDSLKQIVCSMNPLAGICKQREE